MFSRYYAMVRTEDYTGGWFAHNDLLQIFAELGIIGAVVFIGLWTVVAINTTKGNFIAALTMFGIFLQAMVEFQFYTPGISMGMGLALAYHIAYKKA